MSPKYAHIVSFIFVIGLLSLVAVANAQSPPTAQSATAQPSQVDLGNVRGAIVTLYYYDPLTGGKGAIVPLPGGQNPQEVIWNETMAAPGTYTFYKVPQGNYYVEAVHGNHTWFALVTVDQGTSTANVAIPSYNDSGFIATPSPQSTPSTTPPAIP
jgi:Flp pilus assembly protein CpaB